mmetsp:Transcript_8444/g.30472  ORF Transcript_8444/g.30472 Transcript_8444/m.30472 type:complete len:266 (+) Transcript_8444:9-806(+)
MPELPGEGVEIRELGLIVLLAGLHLVGAVRVGEDGGAPRVVKLLGGQSGGRGHRRRFVLALAVQEAGDPLQDLLQVAGTVAEMPLGLRDVLPRPRRRALGLLGHGPSLAPGLLNLGGELDQPPVEVSGGGRHGGLPVPRGPLHLAPERLGALRRSAPQPLLERRDALLVPPRHQVRACLNLSLHPGHLPSHQRLQVRPPRPDVLQYIALALVLEVLIRRRARVPQTVDLRHAGIDLPLTLLHAPLDLVRELPLSRAGGLGLRVQE